MYMNSPKHTATHCNSLKSLQLTATQCKSLHRKSLHIDNIPSILRSKFRTYELHNKEIKKQQYNTDRHK